MSKLYFKYGAMNCGKSTILLQTAHNYEEQGMKVLIAKPAIDTKGATAIVSRLGVKRNVDLLIKNNTKLYTKISQLIDTLNIDCLLIDESQFLTSSQVDDLYKIANIKDVPVICYGLRTDFLNKGFEGSSRLLEIAQSLYEMKNVCTCGRKATCNLRLVNNIPTFIGDQISIDGSANSITYKAVCSKCYLSLKEKYYE